MTDTPAEREAESTWTRLRRRKVVQWGVVYVAAAWGFLQGLEYVTETFHWPAQLRQIASPRTPDRPAHRPRPRLVPRRPGPAARQHARVRDPHAAPAAGRRGVLVLPARNEAATAASAAAQPAAPAAPLEAAAAPDAKSIAVLPFTDMTAKKDQEYLADGMAEELLNLLAKVPDLIVIARTSSFAFKGEKIDDRGDREQPERRPRPGRQRPHVRQSAAHDGAAGSPPTARTCGRKPTIARSTTCSRCRTTSPTRSCRRCRSS